MKAAEKAAMSTRDRKAKSSDPASFDYPFARIRPAFMDLEGMQESAQRRELLQLQLEKERDEAEARNANPKAQGAAQRARKIDQLVIALLAVDAGWIADDLQERSKELMASAEAKGFVPSVETRQVKERLEAARELIEKHKREI